MLFREDFTSLENWRPLFFPNVHKHTMYGIDAKDGERCLKTQSDGSASALVYKGEFNPYEFPRVRWRWKVDNLYQRGDPEKKSGDDYPIRLQIVFKYDPEKAGRLKKNRIGSREEDLRRVSAPKYLELRLGEPRRPKGDNGEPLFTEHQADGP